MHVLQPINTHPDTPKGNVVFIHGINLLNVSPEKIWGGAKARTEEYWPAMLADEFPELAFWSLSYPAGIQNRGMELRDRAHDLLLALRQAGVVDRPLCFIAYSLGGILVKQMLLEAVENAEFMQCHLDCRGVMFLATPNEGSKFANLLDLARSNRFIRSLRLRNSDTQTVNSDYRDKCTPRFRIHKAMFESKRYLKLFTVVPRWSADPRLPGVVPRGVDRHHVDIARCASKQDTVYVEAADLLTRVFVPRPITAGARKGGVLHYLTSDVSHSEFFGRFLARFTSHVLPPLEFVDVHRAKGNEEDTIETFMDLAKHLRGDDAIIFAPKALELVPAAAVDVHALLLRGYPGTIVFIDRRPPDDILALPQVSFVGVDNRRVGMLAAAALFKRAVDTGRERVYLCIRGPGGMARANSFIDSVSSLDAGKTIEELDIKDGDRMDSATKISYAYDRLSNQYPDAVICIFAGNDETASGICHYAVRHQLNPDRLLVVGCDATREMRMWCDSAPRYAVATVTNELHEKQSLGMIRRALREKTVHEIAPRLFPKALNVLIKHDPVIGERIPELVRYL